MTQQLVERFADEHGITYEESLKQIEFLMSYMPRREKGPFAEEPVENNSYDQF